MNIRVLNEMAYNRSDAINKCSDLGYQFVSHFKKLVEEGVFSKDFSHHCDEMQSWYNQVKDIVLKHSKRKISNTQLIDWFFTYGSSTEQLFEDDIVDVYEEFIFALLQTGDVEKSAKIALKED